MCGTRLRLIAASYAACGVTLAAAAGLDPISPDVAVDRARAGIWKAVVPPAGNAYLARAQTAWRHLGGVP